MLNGSKFTSILIHFPLKDALPTIKIFSIHTGAQKAYPGSTLGSFEAIINTELNDLRKSARSPSFKKAMSIDFRPDNCRKYLVTE
jgi:hypothetical protein